MNNFNRKNMKKEGSVKNTNLNINSQYQKEKLKKNIYF